MNVSRRGAHPTGSEKRRQPHENSDFRHRDRNHRPRSQTHSGGHRTVLRNDGKVHRQPPGQLGSGHARRAALDSRERRFGHRPLGGGGQPGVPLGGHRDGPEGGPSPQGCGRQGRQHLRNPHPRRAGLAHPQDAPKPGQHRQREGRPSDHGPRNHTRPPRTLVQAGRAPFPPEAEQHQAQDHAFKAVVNDIRPE